MSSQPLMRAVIEALVFFGMESEDTIQQDAAVSQLEYLASILQDLDEPGRAGFREFVAEFISSEEKSGGRTPRVEFLSELIRNLGLDE